MLASGHFQDAIELPSAADIVLLILWLRLGTPLPEQTAVRAYRGIDGRVPVTGTEWEYEDALQAARARGAPDILAYRNISHPAIDPLDTHARAKSLAQLEALDAFWQRHFADRGVFRAAYEQYQTRGVRAASGAGAAQADRAAHHAAALGPKPPDRSDLDRRALPWLGGI